MAKRNPNLKSIAYNFMMDKDFLVIKLTYECILDGEVNHQLPLISTSTEEILGNSAHQTKVRQIYRACHTAPGRTNSDEFPTDVSSSGQCDILAQILMKDGEVMVVYYSQKCREITGMIAHLTGHKFYKVVNPAPLPICKYMDRSIQLQLIVYSPNERNVTINPASHTVDIKGIHTGPPVPLSFICDSSKMEVDPIIEFRVKKDDDIIFKHPFKLVHRGTEQNGPVRNNPVTRTTVNTNCYIGPGGKMKSTMSNPQFDLKVYQEEKK